MDAQPETPSDVTVAHARAQRRASEARGHARAVHAMVEATRQRIWEANHPTSSPKAGSATAGLTDQNVA